MITSAVSMHNQHFIRLIFKSNVLCSQVLNYQEKLLQSGDADMCYYNFLCSIPVMDVVDFNHIYSNIGYLFFGLLFLVLTAYKVNDLNGIDLNT